MLLILLAMADYLLGVVILLILLAMANSLLGIGEEARQGRLWERSFWQQQQQQQLLATQGARAPKQWCPVQVQTQEEPARHNCLRQEQHQSCWHQQSCWQRYVLLRCPATD